LFCTAVVSLVARLSQVAISRLTLTFGYLAWKSLMIFCQYSLVSSLSVLP